MVDKANHLGEYLRARRDLIAPEQVGITDLGRRRVPGLRREEVAMLAGISAEYYLRLERGRDRNPSTQVLESIARVLGLDDSGTSHLLSLVVDRPRRQRRRPRAERVPDGIGALLPTLLHPAFIEGRYFDILGANAMAGALSRSMSVGRNQLLDLFLDPPEEALHQDWDGITECYASSLRQAVGTDTEDSRFIELVGQLTLASPRFRRLWNRHDVGIQRGSLTRFDHPEVGALSLHRERLAISGTDGLTLVLYHAVAGSESAEKLALLGSSVAAPVEDPRAGRSAIARRAADPAVPDATPRHVADRIGALRAQTAAGPSIDCHH